MLRVLDAATGEEVACFLASDRINSIAAGPGCRRLSFGDENGNFYVLELCGSETGIPSVTSVYLYQADSNSWDLQPTARCEWCGKRFTPLDTVLDTIRDIAEDAHLTSDDSPCAKLPSEVWDAPLLLSECPHCQGHIRFNPFLVDKRSSTPTEVLAQAESASDEQSITSRTLRSWWKFWK
jgi:hypothetical protein